MDWEFEVDKQTTENTYRTVEYGAARACGCNYCQNYLLQQEFIYPSEVINFFETVGIDYHKDSDASEFGEIENRMHIYITIFHFVGKIVSGKSSAVPLPGGGCQLALTPINDTARIGFHAGRSLAFFPKDIPLVQVEFEAHLPWLLNVDLKM